MLIDSCDKSGGSLLTGGRALLPEIEEGGQPIPNRKHELLVVMGSGRRVETQSLLLTGMEDGGQPILSRRHESLVVVVGGG